MHRRRPDDGGRHSLLIRRNITTGELAFYRCWTPQQATLAQLVRVAGIRWSIEESFQAAALLTGQQALGARFGGTLGRWIAATAARLDMHRRGPRRIGYDLVERVASAVHLTVRRDLLPEPALESWLNDHLVGRIPGASDGQ
ncbi:hypothetical protein [Micromonospora sp. WMMD980]|uniref:hypothetical protein n=1 Tax=Micromonospora sp. WMMD980 TaxID=3016088 RepID=UPI002416BA84|nr:hypothetical protein [Micromonospora sp. WMMD980]MDG4800134.1 hypothetical protein [Micromonospora sp. WMMD980]